MSLMSLAMYFTDEIERSYAIRVGPTTARTPVISRSTPYVETTTPK